MNEQIGILDGLPIYRQPELDDDIVRLLESITWGTEDTQYEHYHVRHHLQHIPDPVFYTLRDGEELLGAIVFCRRWVHGGTKAYYIRYFASSPKIRGRGLIGRIARLVMDFIRTEETGPVLFYASTEHYNRRVFHIVRDVGFEQLGSTRTLGFSRFVPKPRGEVRALSAEEFAAFLPRLEQFYAGYAFWIPDNVGTDNNYYVLQDGDDIIAGAQVYRGRWRVENMPGFVGRVLLPLVPYTPLARVFNPKSFEFLALEGIFVAPGQDHRLQDLFETLLRRFGYHSILFWMGEKDPFLPRVLKQNRMGILNRFVRGALARFIVSFHHIDPAEEARIRAMPYYISSLDYI